jgi:TP901 family phage tail tape measure protein
MTTAATIATRLTLNSSQFNKGLDAAVTHASRFAATMSGVGQRMSNFGAGILQSMRNLGSTLTNVGSQLTSKVLLPVLAIAAGLLLLATNAVKVGQEFDKQMHNIQSISRQTDYEIKQLGDAFIQMSMDIRTTTDSASKLAEAYYFIQSAGFAGAEGMEVLRVATKAATAGLTETEVASKAILAVLAAYNLTAADAAHVSDVLFKTVDLGVLTFEELASQLGDVVNTASVTHVPIEVIGAALAAMTRNGISAAESVTALNQLLVQIISPSEKMQNIAKELGVDISLEALRTKGLQQFLADIERIAGADGLLLLFGDNVRALKAVLSLTGENMDDFNSLMEQMGDVTGRTDEAFATQSHSIEAYAKNIKNVFEALKISFTRKFAPGLTRAMESISKFLVKHQPQIGGLFMRLAAIWDKVVTWFSQTLNTKGQGIFTWLNNLIDALPLVWENIKKFGEQIKPTLDKLFGAGEEGEAGDKKTAGILTFILALAGLGPILSMIGTLLPLVIPMILALASGISTNGAGITTFITNVLAALPGILKQIQEIGTELAPKLQPLFDAFMNADPEAIATIVTILAWLAGLAPLFILLGNGITLLSSAYGILSTILLPFVQWLWVVALPIIGAFVVANWAWILALLVLIAIVYLVYLAFKNNWLGITDLTRNMMLAVGEFVAKIIIKIGELLNRLFNLKAAFAGWSPPSWLTGAVTGFVNTMGFKNIPGRDSGGSGMAGEPYLIGRGAQPELFVPNSNGSFYPNADQMSQGGGAGNTYNITVNNPKRETTENSVRRALKGISYTGAVPT